MPSSPKSVQDWIASSHLYEENLFFYFLINLVWYFIGIATLGFKISGLNATSNLLLNFLWCVCLWAAVSFPDFWYWLIWGEDAYLFREEEKFQDILDAIQDGGSREEAAVYLEESSSRLMRRSEILALGFLFMVLLFDAFYCKAWMKNLALVWQPDWVTACIDWVKSHLNMPPINEGWDLFYLDFGDSKTDRILKAKFGDEFQFIQTPFSNTLFFYHFIRCVLFVPIVAALSYVLWQPMQLMGNSDKDPTNIRSIMGFIRACAWSIVMGFFLVLASLTLITDITRFAEYILFAKGIGVITFMYFFIALPVRFFAGWLVFFKRVTLKLLGR